MMKRMKQHRCNRDDGNTRSDTRRVTMAASMWIVSALMLAQWPTQAFVATLPRSPRGQNAAHSDLRIPTFLPAIPTSNEDGNNDVLDRIQKQKGPSGMRGQRYDDNNSTIPSTSDVASILGVQPIANVSGSTWKRAWKIGRRAVSMFHALDISSSRHALDSSLCLQCLWWKALSGNDPNSPAFDNGLSYSLLPRFSRAVTKLYPFFPRLHHANVELRTAYLDRAVRGVVEGAAAMKTGDQQQDDGTEMSGDPSARKVTMITFGGGYDVRSIKLKEQGVIDQAFELDLPQVVESKAKMFATRRFRKRAQRLHGSDDVDRWLPTFYKVDLNELDGVEDAIDDILVRLRQEEKHHHTVVIVFEAVMIYLNEGIPTALLQVISDKMRRASTGDTNIKIDAALCFADRLENIPGGDKEIADEEFVKNGWELTDWLPKPGLARHMGTAVLIRST